MNIKVLFLSFSLLLSTWVSAASVEVSGTGSTIIINKVGGFDGADGADREAAFVAAAQVWADILESPVDIVVDASFSSSLFCISNSATLGSAGPLSTYFGSGAETFGLQNNVWYPTALINAHYGSDYFVGSADITAEFNADLGDPDCLSTSGWYYGMDGNTPAGHIDFYEVVLHELGHGLGILSLVNSDGTNNSGVVDIFTTFLKDQSTGKNWSAMSSGERNTSVVNDSNVVWNGAAVNALAGDLTAGVNAGQVQMYAPSPYEGGSSISHFDTDLTPNELMEPEYTGGASHDHSVALLSDIGWDIYEPAGNVVPNITGQSALAVNEDESLLLALSNLTVSDSDNSYPADFTLTVSSGDNYSVSGSTITPDSNYFGTLTVPVTVNDGEDDSAAYNLSVTVSSVNDVPVISAQSALAIDEDTSLTLTTSALTISDPDDSTFTVSITDGANYSVAGAQVTPSTNFNGTLTLPVVVNDGEVDSASFDVSVTVNAVNDKPSITSTPSVTIDEDTDHSFVLGDFGTLDVEGSALTLSVLTGDNYSVTSNTITPDANFFGTLTVNARVFDGTSYSDTESFDLTVDSVNDQPMITAQSTLTFDEDSELVLTLSDFTIEDVDDSSFTLTVNTGSNYSVSGNTITPSEHYAGALSIPVVVNDGEANSATFVATAIVNAVNDAPVITATPAVNINEDASHTFELSDFSVSDVEGDTVALSILSGANYSVTGLTVIPSEHFNGTLDITARVFDGTSYSATENFDLVVNSVNDLPSITGQSTLSLDEDTSLVLSLSDFTITDVDDSSFTLTVNVGSNYSVSGNTITPSEHYAGVLSIPVVVNDGEANSATFVATATVDAVNDAPSISATPSVSIDEDTSHAFSLTDFTTEDADGDLLTLTVLDGANYSVTDKTITPDANFHGLLTVSAQVSDGIISSESTLFSVIINSVNDIPSITGQSLIGITEGGSYTLQLSDLTVVDVDDSSFTFNINSGPDYSVLGNLITPDAEFSGEITVPIRINDGEDDSAIYNLTINVSAENDAPVIASLPSLSLNEDTSLTLSIDDFEITDVDSTSHNLTVLDGENYSLIGNTVYPDAQFYGVLSVGVYVSDAFDDSATEALIVTVNEINDAPVLSGTPVLNVTMSNDYSVSFSATDIDSTDLTYSVISDHAWLTINELGILSGLPTGSDIGVNSVAVTVSDGDLSDTIMFDLSVDDADSSDLSVSIVSSLPLSLLNTPVELTATVQNLGPAVLAEGQLEIDLVSGTTVNSMSVGCSFNGVDQVRCDFSNLENETSFDLSVSRVSESDSVISATVVGTLIDPVTVNDDAMTTVLFVSEETSPSLTSTILNSIDTRASAFGDLDNDGKSELVVANDVNRAHASFQFNNEYDELELDIELAGHSSATQVGLADLNNDGYLDLVIANTGANAVYMNDPDAGFDAAVSLGSAQSQDVTIVDLNGDSYLDLVFANNGPNQIYLNDQAGGFIASDSFGTANTSAVDVIDFNTDGYPDIAVSNVDDDDYIYLNNGLDQTGSLLNSSAVLLGMELTETHTLVVADLDGDGTANEILVGRTATNAAQGLEVFQLNGSTLSSYFTLDAGDVLSADVGDFNADGAHDILFINAEDVAQLLLQEGTSFSRRHIFVEADAQSVLMTDMNGDDIADIVISNNASSATRLYISDNPFSLPEDPTEDEPVAVTESPSVGIEEEPSPADNNEQTTVVVVTNSGSLGGIVIVLFMALLLLSTRHKPIVVRVN